MVNPGRPLETWTSTETGLPTVPRSVAEAMAASTPENGRSHATLVRVPCDRLGAVNHHGNARGIAKTVGPAWIR